MATTTDFDEWLNNLDDKDIEDIHSLYESIDSISEMGGFNCTQKNGMLFIQNGDNDQTLILATEKAVRAFLAKLDHDFGGDFGWVGGQYDFVRAMRKDD